jgi:sugar (pentulose or hexulose) kinase
MAGEPAVAVVDIGKSNAKLALVDRASHRIGGVRTTPNAVLYDGPYPHYDTERLWQWILDGLKAFADGAEIDTIAVTTHGACFALLSGDGLALPILDYEYKGVEAVHDEYRAVRGDFAETLSPDLPNGLNAGRQIFWQSSRFAGAFERVDAILPYPQYWAWRLCGEKVSEATSLGCHTDLWNPRGGRYSRLAASGGWQRLFPPLVRPWQSLGTILPSVAAATGLPPTCRVVAGIHDSNASLLPHLLARQPPYAVASTGTWMVVFAVGGSLDGLDETRDCLANVDAFGNPVPSARFMAGREYEIVAGSSAEPSDADLARVVGERIMAFPTFAPGTGPFGSGQRRWSIDPARLSPGERAAAASLYCALVTETCLALAGADGPVIVEGPFATNQPFLAALAQLVPRPVIARPGATGTTEGAALLADGPNRRVELDDPPPTRPLRVDLSNYAADWRRSVTE